MKTMDPGYPKPITVWKGIPDSPQGAFVHKENGTRGLVHSGTSYPHCGPALAVSHWEVPHEGCVVTLSLNPSSVHL